jgi:ABC-type transport system involved in cytochrome c biogenesis permease subunit
LKYFGCLLILVGVGFLFFGNKSEKSRKADEKKIDPEDSAKKSKVSGKMGILLLAIASMFSVTSAASGEEEIDWSQWRRMPVFSNGRIMPLATFAEETVESICETPSPRIELDPALLESLEPTARARIESLIPDGSRSMAAHELLLAWLSEPELWQYIPILPAGDPETRRKILDLNDSEASPTLDRIAPIQLTESEAFLQRLSEIHQAKQKAEGPEGTLFRMSETDKRIEKLESQYMIFRNLTFNPNRDRPERALRLAGAVMPLLQKSAKAWQELRGQQSAMPLEPEDQLPESLDDQFRRLMEQLGAFNELYSAQDAEGYHQPVSIREAESMLLELIDQLERMIEVTGNHVDFAFRLEGGEELPDWRMRSYRNNIHTLHYNLSEMKNYLEGAALALYSESPALCIYPSLYPEAMLADRSEAIGAKPWLPLTFFLWASDEMVRRFADPDLPAFEGPDVEVLHRSLVPYLEEVGRKGNPQRKIRDAFAEVAVAWADRRNAQRAPELETALRRFTEVVRENAEKIEPVRRALLPEDQADRQILNQTDYPPSGATEAEIFYQELGPFFWMWVTSLLATILLSLSMLFSLVGRFSRKKKTDRRPRAEIVLFWAGVATLLLSEFVTFLGGAVRAYITGWAPVTNMFETIVLMVFSAALFGLWFTFQPLLGPMTKFAWRATAIPGRTRDHTSSNSTLRTWQKWLVIPRGILTAVVFWIVLWISYGEYADGVTLETILRSFAMNDPIDWIVVVVLLAAMVWWIPRLLLTGMVTPFCRRPAFGESKPTEQIEQIYQRKLFLLAGAVVALLGGLAAYYNPQFNPNIRPLMAVLRSNFWLAVHVTAIIVSYAAGAVCWVLGLIALFAYAFGKYRKSETDEKASLHTPDLAESLAPYLLKTMQAATLLLAIGTVLGARWADHSWGRFWSWDPKEVWALVTLLIYLAILHGRTAKFYGNIGLAVGAVIGSIAIIITWYGINYVFVSGRHTYASGDTTNAWFALVTFIFLNLAIALMGLFRYLMEKSSR